MLKKMIIAALFASFYCMAPADAGQLRFFPTFKVNVPDGWNVYEEADTVVLMDKDESASISVTSGSTQGASLKSIAKAYLEELEGDFLESDSDGGFSFMFTSGSCDSYAIVVETDDGDMYALIAVTGDHPQLEGIIDSFEDR